MFKEKKNSLLNNVILFYILIFIALLLYTLYRAEIFHHGNQFLYYYKYYLIFSLGVIFWIFTYFLKKKFKIQIVTFFSSLIFLLYVYEVFQYYDVKINFTKHENKKQINVKQKVIDTIKKSKNVDVVPAIFPKVILENNWLKNEDEPFPLGGVSNTVTVFCKEGDKFSVYKSDRFGFNNPDIEWNNNELDWLLVGDSFTQGSCVQPGEDIASQIRYLNKKKVISLGMAGNGPLLELASLKEYAIGRKPKVVLWLYFERNDLHDLRIEKSSSRLIKYLDDNYSQNLQSKQKIIDNMLEEFIKKARDQFGKKDESKKISLEKNISFKKILRLKIFRDKTSLDRGFVFGVDPLFEKILINADNFVKKWDGKLYFVYLPDKERYVKKNINDSKYLNRTEVLTLVSRLNIPLIDIHSDFFMKQNDPISFFAHRIYGHYSPEGYQKISKIIVNKVKEKNSFNSDCKTITFYKKNSLLLKFEKRFNLN